MLPWTHHITLLNSRFSIVMRDFSYFSTSLKKKQRPLWEIHMNSYHNSSRYFLKVFPKRQFGWTRQFGSATCKTINKYLSSLETDQTSFWQTEWKKQVKSPSFVTLQLLHLRKPSLTLAKVCLWMCVHAFFQLSDVHG